MCSKAYPEPCTAGNSVPVSYRVASWVTHFMLFHLRNSGRSGQGNMNHEEALMRLEQPAPKTGFFYL